MTVARLRIVLWSVAAAVGIGAVVSAFVVNPWYLGVFVGLVVSALGVYMIAAGRDTKGNYTGRRGDTSVAVTSTGVVLILIGLGAMGLSIWQGGNARGEETATSKIPPPPTASSVADPTPATTTVTVTATPPGLVGGTTSSSSTTSATTTARTSPPGVNTSPPQRGPWLGDSTTIALTVERCGVSKASGILACNVRLENDSGEGLFIRKSGFIAIDNLGQSHRLDTNAKSELTWDAEEGSYAYPIYSFLANTTRAGAIVLEDKLPATAKELQLRFEVGRDSGGLTPSIDVVSAQVSLEGLP